MGVIDEWLARIDAYDRLTLVFPGSQRYAARFADLYIVGHEMHIPGNYPSREVWTASVTPESHAELRARLAPIAENKPEASWFENPAGTTDPFHAGCLFEFEWSDMGMRGWWRMMRRPDGSCVIETSELVDDTAGLCPTTDAKEVVDEAAGREKLCQQLTMRGNRSLMPSIGKPANSEQGSDTTT
jgi:hypothetical protein